MLDCGFLLTNVWCGDDALKTSPESSPQQGELLKWQN